MKKLLIIFASISTFSPGVSSVAACNSYGINQYDLWEDTRVGLNRFFDEIVSSRLNHPEFELNANGKNTNSLFYLPSDSIKEGQSSYQILYNLDAINTFKQTIIDQFFDSQNKTEYGFIIEKTSENVSIVSPEVKYESSTQAGYISRMYLKFDLEGLEVSNSKYNKKVTLNSTFLYSVNPMPEDLHLSVDDVLAINAEIPNLSRKPSQSDLQVNNPDRKDWEGLMIWMISPSVAYYLTEWNLKRDLSYQNKNSDYYFLSFNHKYSYNFWDDAGLFMYDENGQEISDYRLVHELRQEENLKFKLATKEKDGMYQVTCDDFIIMKNPFYEATKYGN